MTPVPKPGKPLCLDNLRPIAVTSLPNRILSTVLATRIETWASFHDDQFGFRRNRSTVDAAFVLSSVLESACTKGLHVYTAFIDFSSAFDTVNHGKLLQKLENKGISEKLLRFLKASYSNASNKVKWGGKLSKAYKVEKGVRQGEPTSGILFNLYLDDLSEAVKEGRATNLMVKGKEIFLLKYADDICLLSLSKAELQISLDRLWNFATKNDLVVNTGKSFSMVFHGSRRTRVNVELQLGDRDLVQVREFKYLGYYFNEKLSNAKSSKRALDNAFGAYSQLCRRIADLPNGCPSVCLR